MSRDARVSVFRAVHIMGLQNGTAQALLLRESGSRPETYRLKDARRGREGGRWPAKFPRTPSCWHEPFSPSGLSPRNTTPTGTLRLVGYTAASEPRTERPAPLCYVSGRYPAKGQK